MTEAALVLIDLQQGFEDPAWGRRNNPDAEANIARLVAAWTERGAPIVRVRHASNTPGSPLAADAPGHAYKPEVAHVQPALEIVKSVHSAFRGEPDLHAWLRANGVRRLVVTGVQTNRCCETTARWAGDLGYEVLFAIDATYTFDDGPLTADELATATATNLDGHFATVVKTADLVG
jgi:nicotinamidase-related amidase